MAQFGEWLRAPDAGQGGVLDLGGRGEPGGLQCRLFSIYPQTRLCPPLPCPVPRLVSSALTGPGQLASGWGWPERGTTETEGRLLGHESAVAVKDVGGHSLCGTALSCSSHSLSEELPPLVSLYRRPRGPVPHPALGASTPYAEFVNPAHTPETVPAPLLEGPLPLARPLAGFTTMNS